MLNEFFISLNQFSQFTEVFENLTSSSFTCCIKFRAASKVYQAAAGFSLSDILFRHIQNFLSSTHPAKYFQSFLNHNQDH